MFFNNSVIINWGIGVTATASYNVYTLPMSYTNTFTCVGTRYQNLKVLAYAYPVVAVRNSSSIYVAICSKEDMYKDRMFGYMTIGF